MEKTATIPELSEAQASKCLRAHGILPTRQRLQIAQVLLTHDQHVSAEQVLDLVRTTGRRVSKATIYNTLGLFAAKGILREVNVDPTRLFYDTNSTVHHHFYNVDTGELSDIGADRIPVEPLPETPPGTVVDGVEVIVRVRKAEHVSA